MSTHLSPIESIREKEREFEEVFDISTEVMLGRSPGEDIDNREKIKSHINLTLTSYIEAEIEKWEGERKLTKLPNMKRAYETANDKIHNSALSSVIEHLQEIKKQLI